MKTVATKITYNAYVEKMDDNVQTIERRLTSQPNIGEDSICICPPGQKPTPPYLYIVAEPDVFSMIKAQQQGWTFYWISKSLDDLY